MQIVINIPKQTYKLIMNRLYMPVDEDLIVEAVRNGIPLPKGHGRLIDISKIDKDRIESDNPIIYLTINGEYTEAISLRYLDNLSTIIEADKAESEVIE